MSARAAARTDLASASVIALTLGLLARTFAPLSADPDLWGHLRFGLDLLETGRVVRPDPYSFLTSGVTWVNHEWLAEALFAVAWRAGAARALVVLKLTLALATFAVILLHLLWRGLHVISASMLVLLVAPLLLPWTWGLRPQAFTYLAFAVTIVAIARAEHGAPRALWLLPPVFLAWANLHGGVLAGVGVVGLMLMARGVRLIAGTDTDTGTSTGAGARAEAWRTEVMSIWLPVVVAVLATLITPYAGDLWLFLRTALAPRPDIIEWHPMAMMSGEGAAYLALLVPMAAGWCWSRREKRAPLLFVALCLALLPLVARRHTPLSVIGLTLLSGEQLADALARLLGRRPASARPVPVSRAIPAWLAIVFLLTGATAGASALVGREASRIEVSRAQYPVEAVALLRASGARTNLAVPMDWGEYVLWHVGPAIKVSLDGRRETVYSEAMQREVDDFAGGLGDWDRLLRRPGVDLALVPTVGWPVSTRLRSKAGWAPLYVDDRSALFGRDGSLAAAQVARLARPRPAEARLTFP